MDLELIIITGVVVLILRRHFNNKFQVLKQGLEIQIQALSQRIDKLEINLFHTATDTAVVEKAVNLQSNDSSTDTAKVESSAPPANMPVAAVATSEVSKSSSEIDQEDTWSQAYSKQRYNAPKPTKFEKVLSEIVQWVITYFKTGNTVVKVGVVVLFFGVSFLVKFASDQGFLPIEIRLIAAAIGGMALTQFGWHMRLKKPDYALVIQGGGIGILFIVTFAALKQYHLIPIPLAFFILVGLAGFTAYLAVKQDSKSLAIFATVGGFLAPILAATGQGNHVVLFGYYVLLNCGIVAIAWFKAWRILNLIGFIFTYIISSAWGILKYQSHNFLTVEPFLILFFLIYVAIPILFAKRQKPELKGYIDGTLVFGNAIMAFGLQTKLVQNFEYAAAYSAFFVSLFYLILARWLYMKKDSNFRLLIEAFVALGIVFATITIPLAFDGHWTAAVWAAEAAGIYWISLKQDRRLGRIFSSVLIFAAGMAFMVNHQRSGFGLPILNSFYFGCIMVAMGSLIISFLGYGNKDRLSENEQKFVPIFFIFGSLWWMVGGYVEIEYYLVKLWHASTGNTWKAIGEFPIKYVKNLSAAYLCGGLLLCSILGRKLDWNYLTKLSFAGVIVMAFLLLRVAIDGNHPFAYGGYFVWPLVFVFHYYILRNNEGLPNIQYDFFKYGHASVLWLLAIVGAWELGWVVEQFVADGTAWKTAAHGLVPVAIATFILLQLEKIKWPLRKYANDYLVNGLGPILVAAWLWALISNWGSSGDSYPLMYLPILNPLEAVQAFFMIIFPLWLFKLRQVIPIANKQIGIALGATYFVWLNGILMRAIHNFTDVPYQFDSLFSSSLVQMSLAIYWSIIGIALMIFASRKVYRWLWIAGVSLLGIVVVKLFLIDLSQTGTLERIASFISVGLFLLLVGYFSPIPPKKSIEEGARS